jgi:hypothetical protein
VLAEDVCCPLAESKENLEKKKQKHKNAVLALIYNVQFTPDLLLNVSV